MSLQVVAVFVFQGFFSVQVDHESMSVGHNISKCKLCYLVVMPQKRRKKAVVSILGS